MKRTIFLLILSIGLLTALSAVKPAELQATAPALLQSADALRIVVLYDEDTAGAEDFAQMLSSYNFSAVAESLTQSEPIPSETPVPNPTQTPVPPVDQGVQIYLPIITSPGTQRTAAAQVQKAVNYSDYDLLVIWKDTGEGESWMSSNPAIYTDLVASKKPVIGIGRGGYAFFQQFEEPYKLPQLSEAMTQRIQAVDRGENFGLWTTPFAIPLDQNQSAELFNSNTSVLTLDMPEPPIAGKRVGQTLDSAGKVFVAHPSESTLFWGIESADALTTAGEQLFVNSIYQLVSPYLVGVAGEVTLPRIGFDPKLLEVLDTDPRGLIQLSYLPSLEEEEELLENGIDLINYVGGTLYYAQFDAEMDTEAAATLPIMRSALFIEPESKLASAILEGEIDEEFIIDSESIMVLVTVFDELTAEELNTIQTTLGVKDDLLAGSLWSLILSEDKINWLATQDGVIGIDLGPGELRVDMREARQNHFVEEVTGFQNQNGNVTYSGYTGDGVVVGVFDTGIFGADPQQFHDDYKDRVVRRVVDTRTGWGRGHGTKVGGTIAGNGSLVIDHRGIAPDAQIWGAKWFGSSAHNKWAINDNDMRISNHSYGADCGQYNSKSVYVDKIVRGDEKTGTFTINPHLYIGSAGNQGNFDQYCRTQKVVDTGDRDGDGDTSDFVSVSGTGLRGYYSITHNAKNALVVGALTDRDDRRLEDYSSRGPTWDGRIKPDVVAVAPVTTTAIDTQGYTGFSGTSAAAPVVSGIAALMMEAYDDANPNGDGLLPSTWRAMLVHSAIDLEHHPGKPGYVDNSPLDPDSRERIQYYAGPDWATGYGMANAERAVELVENQAYQEAFVFASNRTETRTVFIESGSTELRVTMAWDDEPGSGSYRSTSDITASKLVNDLDLTLIDPTGRVHYPWKLQRPPRHGNYYLRGEFVWREDGTFQDPIVHANDIKPAGRGIDRVNNLEQVLVSDENGIPSGTWTIKVKANKLPNNRPQPFSLVYTTNTGSKNTTPTLQQIDLDSSDNKDSYHHAIKEGETLNLLGVAEDLEDADSTIDIMWRVRDLLNQSEPIYTLGFSKSGEIYPMNPAIFCHGYYEIIATPRDSELRTGSETSSVLYIEDKGDTGQTPPAHCQPTVEITNPVDGAKLQQGADIPLEALIGGDTNDQYTVEWYLAEGNDSLTKIGDDPQTLNLDPGSYRVQARYGSATDEVSFEVEEGNAPSVVILNPDDGKVYVWDGTIEGNNPVYSVLLRGLGADKEDGFLTDVELSWEVRRTAPFEADWIDYGQGNDIRVTLPVWNEDNVFDVRVTATDSDGFTATDTHTFTIVGPPN